MIPLIIPHAELSLYRAWKDGHPWQGPGMARGDYHPLLTCQGSLSFSQNRHPSAAIGFDWRGTSPTLDSEWEISVDAGDGVQQDAESFIGSVLEDGGYFILTARFVDAETKAWRCMRWFYVTVSGDDTTESGEAMRRGMRFRSSHCQESVGDATTIPSLAPRVLGEVEWRCGGMSVTAWTFDPDSETWESTPQNEVGDGTRYVQIALVNGYPNDLLLAAYLPRAIPAARAPGLLPRFDVAWTNQLLIRVSGYGSTWHHGIQLLNGITVQANGAPEPLLAYPQDRMLDEPVIVFRFLGRIYASIGHGVLAVPAMTSGEAPPSVHDPAFVLAAAGDPNPATGFTGIVLLPNGAWLDGSVTPPAI